MREGTQAQLGVRGLLGLLNRVRRGQDEGQVGDGKRVDRVSWLLRSLVILFQMNGPSTIEQFQPGPNLKAFSLLLETLSVSSFAEQTAMYGKQ